MGEQSEKIKKNICMGLLAHVDAGIRRIVREAVFPEQSGGQKHFYI